jgi:hypothetical protein
MYKSLLEQIEQLEKGSRKRKKLSISKNDLSSEKLISQEEAKNMLKELILRKSQEFEHIEPEILKNELVKILKPIASVVGLLHGAHYMSMPEQAPSKINPPAQERSIASEKQAQPKKQASPESFRGKQIRNFLHAISLNESSGGKNTNHKTMEHGIHSGDAAIGKYGLMPNTIKEMTARMGRNNPMYRYSKMSSEEISNRIKKYPEHEEKIANYMANHLFDKHSGYGPKMAYDWNQGHNRTKYKAGWEDHPYVANWIKNKQQIEKTPYVAESPEQ